MIRLILLILVFINTSYADSKKYYIQLGSFRQLSVLEQTINRMPSNLRSHIVVINSNGWYIPFAYHTTKRYALIQKLPSYKRYFSDAYITSSPYILNHQIVRNYTKDAQKRYKRVIYSSPKIEPREYQNIAISPTDNISYIPNVTYEVVPQKKKVIIPKPKKKKIIRKKYKYFTKRMLSGRHYYLTYKSKDKSQNLLVKVSFYNHKVLYQPLVGNMNLNEANYLVYHKKLYMFADNFSKDGAFSKIEKNRKKYILVSSWYNGKKLNTLRYYYNLNDAKKYLGTNTSGQLATALEDGEFDGLHQAFEGVEGIYIGAEDNY